MVASDPLIWELHPVPDRYMPEVFKDFFREAIESGGALIASDASDGRVIGSSRFHGYDEEKSEVEIGWTFLARSHWGGVRIGSRNVNGRDSVVYQLTTHTFPSRRHFL